MCNKVIIIMEILKNAITNSSSLNTTFALNVIYLLLFLLTICIVTVIRNFVVRPKCIKKCKIFILTI